LSLEPGAWSLEPGAWSLEPAGTSFHGKYVSPDTRDYQGQQASKWHKKQAETSHHNPARFLSEVEVAGRYGNNLRALEVSFACSKLQARLP